MRETTLARTHDFTLDELHAYDEGTLAPERAAIVAAHLAAGCAACRAWIATSHEVGRLLHTGEGVHAALDAAADAGARLDDPDAFLLATRRARAWRLLHWRLRPRRFVVLLVVLPLKGCLVRHLFRSQQSWETRLSATISLVALTVATLRFVVARPTWPVAAPTAHRVAANGHGDRGAGRGRR